MTENNKHLSRFLDAQERTYDQALKEIKQGSKTSHWMWFIFPQVEGLGLSETSRYYAIKNKREAEQYLQHPLLGSRLIEICNALLALQTNDPVKVFGSIDAIKLKSSMTLFSHAAPTTEVCRQVLEKFFNGETDQKTIQLLKD